MKIVDKATGSKLLITPPRPWYVGRRPHKLAAVLGEVHRKKSGEVAAVRQYRELVGQ